MTKGDRLGHSWRAGRLLYPGLASDFAQMIRAALALYEATGQGDYLERALAWQRAFDAHYANPDNGGYFLTADDAEGLVVRPSSTSDDATPNPNGIAAQNLVRLAALTGDHAWRDKADRLFDGVLAGAQDNLFSHASLLNALDMRLNAAEIVVTGPDHQRFAEAALKLPHLNRIVLRAPVGRRVAGVASGAGQARGQRRQRGVRLRRRALLAAGERTRTDRGRCRLDASWRSRSGAHAMKKPKIKSKPPRPEKLPGQIKYRPPSGKKSERPLERIKRGAKRRTRPSDNWHRADFRATRCRCEWNQTAPSRVKYRYRNPRFCCDP